jgi:membrane associated rhomboid family serine protease
MPTPSTDPQAVPTCYRHRDRETLVSCSNCERPICTSCMVQTAVGVKCPECAGRPVGAARLRPHAISRGTHYVTTALIAVNALLFVLEIVTDRGTVGRGLGGNISSHGWLLAAPVADGDWWRIVTSAFLHAGLAHLAFNMLALWYLGTAFEEFVGPLRFGLIYFCAVVWGSAGALLFSPNSPTVGASGGVFGLMAAILVLERQRGVTIVSGAGVWLGINLVITFTLPGISIGGHLGGIVGGALAALAVSNFGRGHMAARRMEPAALVGVLAVLAVGVFGALSIANAKAPDRAFGAVQRTEFASRPPEKLIQTARRSENI